MGEQDHYFLRGVKPIETASSLLVSSSKYLNDGRLRDWLAMICLRKNGPDFPAPAELIPVIKVLDELRDLDHIEHLFTEERRVNTTLDAWFAEGYLSPKVTLEDYAKYPPGSPGGILYAEFVGRYEVEFSPRQWEKPTSQYEFYRRRETQMHDLEHILTGGGVDALGELVPSWFRMTNVPKHIKSPELVSELMTYKMFASLRYTVRTIIHYPEVWPHCADAIHRGMVAGWASDALFMQNFEPILGLPLEEARVAVGLRNVVDRDTGPASAFWEGRAGPPPPLSGDEIIGRN